MNYHRVNSCYHRRIECNICFSSPFGLALIYMNELYYIGSYSCSNYKHVGEKSNCTSQLFFGNFSIPRNEFYSRSDVYIFILIHDLIDQNGNFFNQFGFQKY